MLSRDVRLPSRRITDLVTTEAGSDIIVYDQKTAAIHTLNDVAGSVWRTLDGTKSLHLVVTETGFSEETVRQTVTKLADANLLDGPIATDVRANQSRRDFMRKAAIGGAVAVPLLISTTAATSAQAISVCDTCGGSAQATVDLSLANISGWVDLLNSAVTNLIGSANFSCSCGLCYPNAASVAPTFSFIGSFPFVTGIRATLTLSWSGSCTSTIFDPIAAVVGLVGSIGGDIFNSVVDWACSAAGSFAYLLPFCGVTRPASDDQPTSIQQSSVEEAPSAQSPNEEAPVDDAPADDATVDDAPVEPAGTEAAQS